MGAALPLALAASIVEQVLPLAAESGGNSFIPSLGWLLIEACAAFGVTFALDRWRVDHNIRRRSPYSFSREFLSILAWLFLAWYIGWALLWWSGQLVARPRMGWWDGILVGVGLFLELALIDAEMDRHEKLVGRQVLAGPTCRQGVLAALFSSLAFAIACELGFFAPLDNRTTAGLGAALVVCSVASVPIVRAGQLRRYPLAILDDFVAGLVVGLVIILAAMVFWHVVTDRVVVDQTFNIWTAIFGLGGGLLNVWRKTRNVQQGSSIELRPIEAVSDISSEVGITIAKLVAFVRGSLWCGLAAFVMWFAWPPAGFVSWGCVIAAIIALGKGLSEIGPALKGETSVAGPRLAERQARTATEDEARQAARGDDRDATVDGVRFPD